MFEKNRFEENNPKGGEANEQGEVDWKQRQNVAVRRDITKKDARRVPLEEAKAFKGMRFK